VKGVIVAKMWNNPPGWPTPPDGWLPPEGWTPPPGAHPPPHGWQLIVDLPDPPAKPLENSLKKLSQPLVEQLPKLPFNPKKASKNTPYGLHNATPSTKRSTTTSPHVYIDSSQPVQPPTPRLKQNLPGHPVPTAPNPEPLTTPLTVPPQQPSKNILNPTKHEPRPKLAVSNRYLWIITIYPTFWSITLLFLAVILPADITIIGMLIAMFVGWIIIVTIAREDCKIVSNVEGSYKPPSWCWAIFPPLSPLYIALRRQHTGEDHVPTVVSIILPLIMVALTTIFVLTADGWQIFSP